MCCILRGTQPILHPVNSKIYLRKSKEPTRISYMMYSGYELCRIGMCCILPAHPSTATLEHAHQRDNRAKSAAADFRRGSLSAPNSIHRLDSSWLRSRAICKAGSYPETCAQRTAEGGGFLCVFPFLFLFS